MDEFRARTPKTLPERGQPRLAACGICGHQHACYVADRPGPIGPDGPSWLPTFACLGCLMRAADPAARIASAECVPPA
jgi:hypothetical protein